MDPPPSRSLRSSLQFCVAEGVTAEVVAACAGATASTAWALHLGCGPQLVGVLGALPFLAQLFQGAGAWLTARAGARRAALWTVAFSRQCFLPLVLLPWLPLDTAGKQALLVACCAAHHAIGILCNNAWTTWVGDLVPGALRGRYFGRRTSICTAASAGATLAVGAALDGARAAAITGPALAALSLVACGFGAASVVLMARQHGGLAGAAPRWTLAAALAPFADARARRLLAYLVLWHVAIGFSAPFYGVYLLQDLGASFTTLAWVAALAALARTATAPAWGRAVDRYGTGPVLLACTAGLAVSPLSWIVCSRVGLWPILLDAVVGGALLGGHAVATFTAPLALAPARSRPHYLAAFSMAGGAAFGLASACGGAVVAASGSLAGPASALLPVHLTFAASLVGRSAAALAALGLAGASVARSGALASRPWIAVRGLARPAPGVARVRSLAVRAGLRWMGRGTSRPTAARAGASSTR